MHQVSFRPTGMGIFRTSQTDNETPLITLQATVSNFACSLFQFPILFFLSRDMFSVFTLLSSVWCVIARAHVHIRILYPNNNKRSFSLSSLSFSLVSLPSLCPVERAFVPRAPAAIWFCLAEIQSEVIVSVRWQYHQASISPTSKTRLVSHHSETSRKRV